MTPERHLAAILAAWTENPGYGISPAMHEALVLAEKDFDGVEFEADNDQTPLFIPVGVVVTEFDLNFNQTAVLMSDPYRPEFTIGRSDGA